MCRLSRWGTAPSCVSGSINTFAKNAAPLQVANGHVANSRGLGFVKDSQPGDSHPHCLMRPNEIGYGLCSHIR
eukprot:2464377-Prymnesium_polylepis.1